MLQQCKPETLSVRTAATITLDIIVAFETVGAFVIPLAALLTSTPLTWCLEHLWNSVYSKEYTFRILLYHQSSR
jgi:hypothetical protein